MGINFFRCWVLCIAFALPVRLLGDVPPTPMPPPNSPDQDPIVEPLSPGELSLGRGSGNSVEDLEAQSNIRRLLDQHGEHIGRIGRLPFIIEQARNNVDCDWLRQVARWFIDQPIDIVPHTLLFVGGSFSGNANPFGGQAGVDAVFDLKNRQAAAFVYWGGGLNPPNPLNPPGVSVMLSEGGGFDNFNHAIDAPLLVEINRRLGTNIPVPAVRQPNSNVIKSWMGPFHSLTGMVTIPEIPILSVGATVFSSASERDGAFVPDLEVIGGSGNVAVGTPSSLPITVSVGAWFEMVNLNAPQRPPNLVPAHWHPSDRLTNVLLQRIRLGTLGMNPGAEIRRINEGNGQFDVIQFDSTPDFLWALFTFGGLKKFIPLMLIESSMRGEPLVRGAPGANQILNHFCLRRGVNDCTDGARRDCLAHVEAMVWDPIKCRCFPRFPRP